ncbi:hypothetical protein LTR36_006755 [Oleoguttula mirabilis]|uniref:Protein kinase domain-containing protein n=1 Tax=Oleoguttula mirabilis TaxID=1507867 RepID=A0AAV9JCK0_9PEZI|nr:hypothetical protein LTR36_006755 [Oleoguttula mirabilis]
MESYRHAQHQAHTRTSHLTKLYSDTKKSALTSINVHSTANAQFPALHRKFKIQKDRLITWGLAWSDDEKGSDGNIDDAVSKAGLAETVESVLRNIKDVTEEAERIQQASLPQHILTHTGDKLTTSVKPAAFDHARNEDLLNDLTISIDTLYDLSQSRRLLARGEHPNFSSASTDKSPSARKTTPVRKSLLGTPSFASSEVTLVNPSPFHRPSLSPYAGLPPWIEASALRLPDEGPPPYEAVGVPSTTRLVARLVRAKASESVQNALGSSAAEVPVLVEYANFDTIYRDTHVPPPLQRLEALAAYLQPMRPESQTNLSLLGYFEDPSQPRIGLVYDVPYSIQNRLQGTADTAAQSLIPVSLLKLVQKASKSQPSNGDIAIPALESRFRLAFRLTEQLRDLHARDMPHGNINSSSVVFTMTGSENPLRQAQLQSPLWASFDLFSKCSVEGTRRDINLNIYKHPHDSPQSLDRDASADVKYDLYGLALVLLEVGLWTPLGDLYKPKYTLEDFKLRIEKLWIPKLAHKCGSAYMRVVQTCFRISDSPALSKLTTGGVYEHLLTRLGRCCQLDEDDFSVSPMLYSDSISDMGTLSYEGKMSKSSWHPSPDQSPLSRQQSAPNELLRSQSIETYTAEAPYRLSSLPNLAAASVPMAYAGMSPSGPAQLSRHPSIRSQMPRRKSIPQRWDQASRRITTTPSFKEYKRKITFIQQRWREHRARCHATPTGSHGSAVVEQAANARDQEADHASSKPKRLLFPHLELPHWAQLDWEQKYAYQLAKLCERALKDATESSHIALTMSGESPETARPTFLITCEKSTTKIKQVLKRHFRCDSSIYDVRVRKGDKIRRCRRSKRHGDSAAYRSMAPAGALDKAANPDYQERPLCGASIGAYRDDEHLPPVSFGGIVLVDGTAYGMSVHHMLEPEDDEDTEDDAEAGAAEDTDSDGSSIGSSDNISIYSHSDDESTVRPPSTISDTDDTPSAYEGDVAGITPDDYEDIAITQPALDDAIDCDLHVDVDEDDDEEEEDSGIDEDHLLSYKLGQVHASSGLKRSAASTQEGFKSISQSLPQEIDWALFELMPPRANPFNVIKGGTKYCAALSSKGEDSFPVAVRQSAELACAKVHCVGRTSGLASGVISSTMELVKIHGRSTFSASWTVDGDFGVGGDSGAWVISNDDGKVCGHVLASKKGRTFICPMDLLLEDIKQTLGARQVALPSVTSAREMSKYDAQRAVSDALSTLRLGSEVDGGGVALPPSPVRRSMVARSRLEYVETAG